MCGGNIFPLTVADKPKGLMERLEELVDVGAGVRITIPLDNADAKPTIEPALDVGQTDDDGSK